MQMYFMKRDTNEEIPIRNVYIALTEDELLELADALNHMRDAPERGPDSHYHLTATDSQEVTIWTLAS